LIIKQNGTREAFEFKYVDAPKVTKSMVMAIEELSLEKVYVICPGEKQYQMSEKIIAIGLADYLLSIQF